MPDSSDSSDSSTARFAYPVFLDLHDVAVLVVGGGPIGARKAAGLAAAGARVRLVARSVSDAVERAPLEEIREHAFVESDLEGVRLAVTATGIEAVDREVAELARERMIWVNAADQPDDCGFILPAITRAGPISVAVSSDGQSPAMAQYVRDQVAPLLDEDLIAVAEELARRRRDLRDAGESTEGRNWRALIEELLPDRHTQISEPPAP